MRRGIRTAATALCCLLLSGCDAGPRDAGPSDPESLVRGRALFLEHCALCHGERGDGRGPRRRSLSRAPADFGSPLFQPDRERVRRAIRDGVPGSDMPGWQRLGEPAVDDLASYVLSLAR